MIVFVLAGLKKSCFILFPALFIKAQNKSIQEGYVSNFISICTAYKFTQYFLLSTGRVN